MKRQANLVRKLIVMTWPKAISHNRAQVVLLAIWLTSLGISCFLVGSVISEIDNGASELAEQHNIRHSDPNCEIDFANHNNGNARQIVGRLQDRGVNEQYFCGDAYLGTIIQNYLLPITSLYLPILVIMIASVIRETEGSKDLPISMQKFGFALTGFVIAQIIVIGSIFGAVNGDVISFQSAEFQVISASIVNTLMMLAITLCFPEYRGGQQLMNEAVEIQEDATKTVKTD